MTISFNFPGRESSLQDETLGVLGSSRKFFDMSSGGGGGGGDESSNNKKKLSSSLGSGSWLKFSSKNKGESGRMDLVQVLALNALELTAPAAFFIRPTFSYLPNSAPPPFPSNTTNNRLFIQISGHPGSLAPAGPTTLWKKQTEESTEEAVYEYLSLHNDPMGGVIPKYHGKKIWKDELFLELEDLLHGFGPSPAIMDIKMGCRTFLEKEVSNSKARPDLYAKMLKVDNGAPTEEERAEGAVTKLRYMKFREEQSSTSLLAFRIEAIQFFGSSSVMDVKTVRSERQVREILSQFIREEEVERDLVSRLKFIRETLTNSQFFRFHEVIGSSLLIVHDEKKVSAHLIDFAKTKKSPTPLSHYAPWEMGNREDGYLLGLSNLIRILEADLEENFEKKEKQKD